MPDLDELRHRIDALTPDIPEGLSREAIGTLLLVTQVEGMAIALRMVVNGGLRDCPEVLQLTADELSRVSAQLMANL